LPDAVLWPGQNRSHAVKGFIKRERTGLMTRGFLRFLRGNTIALLALFLALGGTTYAATALPKNSVGTKQLKKNAVTAVKIKNGNVTTAKLKNGSVTNAKIAGNAVTGAKVRDDSLTGSDVSEATLGTVPSATSATNATNASNSTNLSGTPGSGYLKYGTTIPSGKTVTGVFGIVDNAAAGGELKFDYASFPLPAPVGLPDANVNFKAGTPTATDGDAACTGTSANPTAPPGKVCLYQSGLSNANVASLAGFQYDVAADSRQGFGVRAISTAAGLVVARGAWAYTAP
jgi:hypothetical protein